MEKKSVLIDHGEFVKLFDDLNPLSARLFIYMYSKNPHGKPFRMTHATMVKECGIAAPYRCIKRLVDHGYLTRRHVGRHENEYQIVKDICFTIHTEEELDKKAYERGFNEGWNAAKNQWRR